MVAYTGKNRIGSVLPVADLARWGDPEVGGVEYTTSAFAYAWTTFEGSYEIRNNALGTVSAGSVANGVFPSWGATEAIITADAMLSVDVMNLSTNYVASCLNGVWDHTTSTPSGGIGTSGSLFTSAAGEKWIPVASSPAGPGKWLLPNGQEFEAGVFSTGSQQYRIMEQPGPWPAGSAINTASTIPMLFAPIFTDLGLILESQGGHLESLTDNWKANPGVGGINIY